MEPVPSGDEFLDIQATRKCKQELTFLKEFILAKQENIKRVWYLSLLLSFR